MQVEGGRGRVSRAKALHLSKAATHRAPTAPIQRNEQVRAVIAVGQVEPGLRHLLLRHLHLPLPLARRRLREETHLSL